MSKKKKDILFLCQFFYPEYISSATLPFDTAVALAEEGYLVGAVCGYPREYNIKGIVPTREVYKKIAINRVKYLQLKREFLIGRVVNYISLLLNILFKLPYMGAYKLIIVYSNPPMLPLIAVLAKKFFSCKIFFVSYDVYPEIGIMAGKIKKKGILDKGFQYINKIIVKNCDKIIAVSEDMKKYLEEYRHSISSPIVSIPNWYEDEKIVETVSTVLDGVVQKKDFVISYLGNLGTCQDLSTMLDAMRKLKTENSVHFIIAGHGNKMSALEEIVKRENLNFVHIFPFLHDEDYKTVLFRSNAFIVTLIPGLAGLCAPSKAYSYFMAGKPIFAIMDHEMEIARDIEQEKCGFVIPFGAGEELKDKILSLKAHPEDCVIYGENCKEVFKKKYNKKVCLQQYIKLVKEEMKHV